MASSLSQYHPMERWSTHFQRGQLFSKTFEADNVQRNPSPSPSKMPTDVPRSTPEETSLTTSLPESTAVIPSNGIDLTELAHNTRDALEALKPFYDAGNKWYIFTGKKKKIALEVARYITAIDDSIVASQYGHTIATEAIDIATYITQMKTEKASGEELKTLNEYLEKTSRLVELGHDSAAKSLEGFRDVRRTLNPLIQQYEQPSSFSFSAFSFNDSKEVQNRINSLEKFSESLSLYVTWWNEMKMRHNAQKIRDAQIARYFSMMRQREVLNQWQNLKKDYVAYTIEITKVQDDYGKMFKKKA